MKRNKFTKRIALIVFSALLITMLIGCTTVNFGGGGGVGIRGTGSVQNNIFNVGTITEVDVQLLCNIVLDPAPSSTVTFEAQANLMEYITVEEVDGVLRVRSTRSINVTDRENTPTLTVSSASLSRVTHSGAGRLTSTGAIANDTFNLNISGAADGTLQLDVNNLSINLAGAGNLDLSGTADTATISMAGAGKIEALELDTRIASINLAGAGSVKISCSEKLNITAGGVGTVEYRGSPTVDTTRGGLVTVRQVD